MSIASIGGSPVAFSTLEIAPSSTDTSTGTTASSTATSDTASISAAAQQASNSSAGTLSQFDKALWDVRNKINAYEHQVTWQLEHKVAVTGPSGTAGSNSSAGTAISPAAGELVNTQVTSALGSQVSLEVSGSLGLTKLSFASGTKLSAIAAAVNDVSSATGVKASASGATLKFDAAGSGVNNFVTVSALDGTFTTTPTSNAAATAQTVADGIVSLESGLVYPDVRTTSDAQNARLSKDINQLNSDQTQFQTFVAKRIERNYTDAAKDLGNKINAFEHQVTWQIDHGVPVTLPDGTTAAAANTSTGTTTTAANSSSGTTTTTGNSSTGTTTTPAANSSTGTTTIADTNSSTGTTTTASANSSTGATTVSLADTISSGIASLETATEKLLGPLSSNFASQFQQLQQSFTTEQTRFAGFTARRLAYRTARSTTGAAQDVTA